MNKGKLQEIGEKLEVSQQDIDSIRKESLKEKWIYPITAVIVAAISAFLGWVVGKDNERLVSRDTGREYPYSSGIGYLGIFIIGATEFGLGSLITFLKTLNKGTGERKKVFVIMICIVVLSIFTFFVSYKLSQPVEYYSGAIDYGVYSREEKP